MKKRLLPLMLSAVMIVPVACGLAACGEKSGSDKGSAYNITVWVGENTKSLTERRIKSFNETNAYGVTFKAEVHEVSESKAAGDAIGNADAADLFCFAQDQLARLVRYNALAAVGSNAANTIKDRNDADSVAAATLGDTVWAFPLTSDNAYFLYYDTRVISEAHAANLEDIIADCEAAGKNFAFNLTETGGGWYAASFFYATGCESEWPTDSNGKFTADYRDTIDYEHGSVAARAMKKLMNSNCYLASDKASTFDAPIPSAAVVSGIWDYNTAKEKLGDHLGVAPLPSFTVDGESYRLKTYIGHKFVGVKPQADAYRNSYLQQLALYLTSEECQLERFEEVGWGPSNKVAQEKEEVLASEALNVIARSATMPQGQYPTDWWTYMVDLVINIRNASEDVLSIPFNTYQQTLPGLLNSIS